MSEPTGPGSLYDLYVSRTPEGQRPPSLQGSPNRDDFIRQNYPDIFKEWERMSAPQSGGSNFFSNLFSGFSNPRPAQAGVSGGGPSAATRAPDPFANDDIAGGAGLFMPPSWGSPAPAPAPDLARPSRVPPAPRPEQPGTFDWEKLLSGETAGGWTGQGPGVYLPPIRDFQATPVERISSDRVGVPTDLFRLSETPEEREMITRELADIEARRAAGDVALRGRWSEVQSFNTAAAERARSLASQAGEAAASVWSQAAQQALFLAQQRAEAAGQFSGRAEIGIDPVGGAQDWAGFMQSQAPAEQLFAQRQQERLGSDLDWMAGIAGSQGAAYAGDLQRQSQMMSADRAADHNRRVQERVGQERMTQAQMQMQADLSNQQSRLAEQQFNAQMAFQSGEAAQQRAFQALLAGDDRAFESSMAERDRAFRAAESAASRQQSATDPVTQLRNDTVQAIGMNDPGILITKYGFTRSEALRRMADAKTGLLTLKQLQSNTQSPL